MSKVQVNWDLCESNAICVGLVPTMFELDDDDYLQIEDPTVTDENRAAVERAVASCPRAALSIVEE